VAAGGDATCSAARPRSRALAHVPPLTARQSVSRLRTVRRVPSGGLVTATALREGKHNGA
jgi:hypothetical protein